MTVTLGGVTPCVVESANSTDIVCRVGRVTSAGAASVELFMEGKGYAVEPVGIAPHTVVLGGAAVVGVRPSAIADQGQTVLSVLGSAFNNGSCASNQVTVDGTPCAVLACPSVAEVQCLFDATAADVTPSNSVPVEVLIAYPSGGTVAALGSAQLALQTGGPWAQLAAPVSLNGTGGACFAD